MTHLLLLRFIRPEASAKNSLRSWNVKYFTTLQLIYFSFYLYSLSFYFISHTLRFIFIAQSTSCIPRDKDFQHPNFSRFTSKTFVNFLRSCTAFYSFGPEFFGWFEIIAFNEQRYASHIRTFLWILLHEFQIESISIPITEFRDVSLID